MALLSGMSPAVAGSGQQSSRMFHDFNENEAGLGYPLLTSTVSRQLTRVFNNSCDPRQPQLHGSYIGETSTISERDANNSSSLGLLPHEALDDFDAGRGPTLGPTSENCIASSERQFEDFSDDDDPNDDYAGRQPGSGHSNDEPPKRQFLSAIPEFSSDEESYIESRAQIRHSKRSGSHGSDALDARSFVSTASEMADSQIAPRSSINKEKYTPSPMSEGDHFITAGSGGLDVARESTPSNNGHSSRSAVYCIAGANTTNTDEVANLTRGSGLPASVLGLSESSTSGFARRSSAALPKKYFVSSANNSTRSDEMFEEPSFQSALKSTPFHRAAALHDNDDSGSKNAAHEFSYAKPTGCPFGLSGQDDLLAMQAELAADMGDDFNEKNGAEDNLAQMDAAEREFAEEHRFIKDDAMASANTSVWTVDQSMAADRNCLVTTPRNGADPNYRALNLTSMSSYMGQRSAALGSISHSRSTERPTFGVTNVRSPTNNPRALYVPTPAPSTIGLDKTTSVFHDELLSVHNSSPPPLQPQTAVPTVKIDNAAFSSSLRQPRFSDSLDGEHITAETPRSGRSRSPLFAPTNETCALMEQMKLAQLSLKQDKAVCAQMRETSVLGRSYPDLRTSRQQYGSSLEGSSCVPSSRSSSNVGSLVTVVDSSSTQHLACKALSASIASSDQALYCVGATHWLLYTVKCLNRKWLKVNVTLKEARYTLAPNGDNSWAPCPSVFKVIEQVYTVEEEATKKVMFLPLTRGRYICVLELQPNPFLPTAGSAETLCVERIQFVVEAYLPTIEVVADVNDARDGSRLPLRLKNDAPFQIALNFTTEDSTKSSRMSQVLKRDSKPSQIILRSGHEELYAVKLAGAKPVRQSIVPQHRREKSTHISSEFGHTSSRNSVIRSNEQENTANDTSRMVKSMADVTLRAADGSVSEGELSVEPMALDYATTKVGGRSVQKVLVKNVSAQEVRVRFTCQPGAVFASRHSEHTVKPMMYCLMPVYFQPSRQGQFGGELLVQCGRAMFRVKLTGSDYAKWGL